MRGRGCGPVRYMTNRFAIAFGLFLVALIAFDVRANDGEYIVFWGRQGLRLIEWLKFWR